MMVRPFARSIRAAFACAVFGLAVSGAAGQDGFPAKPIKLMVPLAAGGGIDFTARTTAQKLSDVLGQQVVVENQGGAGGVLRGRARGSRWLHPALPFGVGRGEFGGGQGFAV